VKDPGSSTSLPNMFLNLPVLAVVKKAFLPIKYPQFYFRLGSKKPQQLQNLLPIIASIPWGRL
jgi:hypothetical protein